MYKLQTSAGCNVAGVFEKTGTAYLVHSVFLVWSALALFMDIPRYFVCCVYCVFVYLQIAEIVMNFFLYLSLQYMFSKFLIGCCLAQFHVMFSIFAHYLCFILSVFDWFLFDTIPCHVWYICSLPLFYTFCF